MPIYYYQYLYYLTLTTQQISDSGQTVLNPLQSIDFTAVTDVTYPNARNVNTGSCTIVISHPVINMNVSLKPTLYRVKGTYDGSSMPPLSSDILSTSSFVAQTTAVTNTFTGTDPSWSGSSCSDRIALNLNYTNTNTMTAQTLTINYWPLSYVSSSIPINTGSCPVNRNRTFTF